MADPTVDPEELARKRAKARDAMRAWRAANPQKALATRDRAIRKRKERYVADPRYRNKVAGEVRERRAKTLAEVRATDRARYQRNRAKRLAAAKAHYAANRETLIARVMARARAAPEKEKARRKAARPKTNAKRKERYHSDINFRISVVVRARLVEALNGRTPAGSAVRDLGCSLDEFRAYIAAQFRPGMTWDNWARDVWHLDHRKPLASFNLTDPEQFRVAVHFTNYQPLWAVDNLRKGAKPGPPQTAPQFGPQQ